MKHQVKRLTTRSNNLCSLLIIAWDWLLARRIQRQLFWSTGESPNKNLQTRWRTQMHVPVIFRAYLRTQSVSDKTALSACQKPVAIVCRICPSTLSCCITLQLSHIYFRLKTKFNLELAVFVIDQLLIEPSALRISLNGRWTIRLYRCFNSNNARCMLMLERGCLTPH